MKLNIEIIVYIFMKIKEVGAIERRLKPQRTLGILKERYIEENLGCLRL